MTPADRNQPRVVVRGDVGAGGVVRVDDDEGAHRAAVGVVELLLDVGDVNLPAPVAVQRVRPRFHCLEPRDRLDQGVARGGGEHRAAVTEQGPDVAAGAQGAPAARPSPLARTSPPRASTPSARASRARPHCTDRGGWLKDCDRLV